MKALVPLAIFASASLFAADLAVVEEIVAKCNGDIVTRGDLDRSRKQLIEALRHEGLTGPALEQALQDQEKNLLRDRIDQLLLVQKGKDLNINVDGEVAKRIASIQKDSSIADPDKFHDWVKEQAGMPFEDFQSDMKNDMLGNASFDRKSASESRSNMMRSRNTTTSTSRNLCGRSVCSSGKSSFPPTVKMPPARLPPRRRPRTSWLVRAKENGSRRWPAITPRPS